MKRVEGWDLDAFLVSPPVLRAVDLFCYATMIFNAFCSDMVVGWLLLGTALK
jgi:hypothetical protein